MNRNAFTHTTTFDAGLPGSRPNDFVVVDDTGDFIYYPSEAIMLEDLEYVGEAASIFDRAGNDFRLTLEGGRNLRLGAPFGTVEFTWLRQAWKSARHREPKDHRLLRFYPATLDSLVAGIFETLTLELAKEASKSPWVVEVEGEASHVQTLKDVDLFLGKVDHLERTMVVDPFGHNYRPTRHAPHLLQAIGAHAIFYVEIEGQPRKPATTKP